VKPKPALSEQAKAQRVAVAGWQWYRWIAGGSAVILIPDSTCGSGYWLGGSGFYQGREFFDFFFCAATDTNSVKVCGGVTGGSGWVAVVAIDS
jgi:hypothetical protein